MKLLFVSYGDLDYDGRLRSLLTVFKKIGSVHSICRGSREPSENSVVYNSSYGKFIIKAIQFARSINNIDVLVLDNRRATIPGFIIRKMLKPAFTILDCRELYLFRETKPLTGKVGCIFEKKMAQLADIVICANEERAIIMQQEYALKKKPLTYENLRKLEYSTIEGLESAKNKLDQYIKEDEIRIVSSSGCSLSRTNDILVNNLKNVKYRVRLFLVGTSAASDIECIRQIAAEDKKNEITILGQLNQDELNALAGTIPLGYIGEPKEIAGALEYILTADYLTGQVISPNGGFVLQ